MQASRIETKIQEDIISIGERKCAASRCLQKMANEITRLTLTLPKEQNGESNRRVLEHAKLDTMGCAVNYLTSDTPCLGGAGLAGSTEN